MEPVTVWAAPENVTLTLGDVEAEAMLGNSCVFEGQDSDRV
jgi:hypothetical protein